jgi:hypothetical protein
MPGENLFADKDKASSTTNPRLVFVLELPMTTKQHPEPQSLKEANNGRRSSLWLRSTKSIRKVFSRLSNRPRSHWDWNDDTEVTNLLGSPSISYLSTSHTLTDKPSDKDELKVVADKLGCFKIKDVLSPVTSSPESVGAPSPSTKIASLAPLVRTPRPLPTPITPDPTPSQLPIVAPLTKRASYIIRGRDLPFPPVPIGAQRRLSLPVLPPMAGGSRKPERDTVLRALSYSPPQELRPILSQRDSSAEAGADNDPPRGRPLRRKPLSTPPPILSPHPSVNSVAIQSDATTVLLHVPPFPLPHRVSQSTVPRRLPSIPSSPASCLSRSLRDSSSDAPTATNQRVRSKTTSSRRPAPLHLVSDNTLIHRVQT